MLIWVDLTRRKQFIYYASNFYESLNFFVIILLTFSVPYHVLYERYRKIASLELLAQIKIDKIYLQWISIDVFADTGWLKLLFDAWHVNSACWSDLRKPLMISCCFRPFWNPLGASVRFRSMPPRHHLIVGGGFPETFHKCFTTY